MDGAAWWATVHGVTKSRTRLSNFTNRGMCPERVLVFALSCCVTLVVAVVVFHPCGHCPASASPYLRETLALHPALCEQSL